MRARVRVKVRVRLRAGRACGPATFARQAAIPATTLCAPGLGLGLGVRIRGRGRVCRHVVRSWTLPSTEGHA